MSRRFTLLIALASCIALSLFSACSDDDNPRPATSATSMVSASENATAPVEVAGPAGARLTLPTGSVTADTNFTIALMEVAPLVAGFESVSSTVDISADTTSFTTATVTLPVTSLPSGANLSDVVIYKVSDGSNTPEQLTTTSDSASNSVSADTTSFSRFWAAIARSASDPDPTVNSVTPNTGSEAGGTAVEIRGTNFAFGQSVTFGSEAATDVVFRSPSRITCVTPAGSGSVSVSVGSGSLSSGFTYQAPQASAPTINSVLPSAGPLSGTPVTINGSGFSSGSVSVTFGGNAATNVIVVLDTQLTCVAPAASTAGSVDVTVDNGAGTATLSNGYEYIDHTVTVSSVSPNTGSEAGGDSVTISGSGFDYTGATATVTFGVSPATNVSVVSDTEITCDTPAGTGTVTVTVSLTVGSGVVGSNALVDGFTYSGGGSSNSRPDSFDFQGSTDPMFVMTLVSGTYDVACYKTFDSNVPIGYYSMDWDHTTGVIDVRDDQGVSVYSVTYEDGLGEFESVQFGVLSISARDTQSEQIAISFAEETGTVTVSTTFSGDNALFDNDFKEVDTAIPQEFTDLAGTYTATLNSSTMDIEVFANGTIEYSIDGGSVTAKTWDGQDDWVRFFSSTSYQDGANRADSDIFELTIDGTSVGSQDLFSMKFDNRLETSPFVRVNSSGGTQFNGAGNQDEAAVTSTGNLPDFFPDFAGTHRAVVSSAVTDGGGASSPPITFTEGEEVTFTIDAAGSITIKGHTFTWDDSDDLWQNEGSTNFISVGDLTTYIQIRIDTDYKDGFEVQLNNVQFADSQTVFTNWVFALPAK